MTFDKIVKDLHLKYKDMELIPADIHFVLGSGLSGAFDEIELSKNY